MENWQDKRINEINETCSTKPGVAENFIEEVYSIYESKADSYESFKQEQEEKKAKYIISQYMVAMICLYLLG